MYLIDANIFLEVLLDRKDAPACIGFLKKIEEGKIKAVLTSFSLHAIEVVMANFKKLKELETFLTSLTHYQGLVIYHTSLAEDLQILGVMKKVKLDFDDAVQYFVAEKFNFHIVSLDIDFDGKPIKRVEPKDL